MSGMITIVREVTTDEDRQLFIEGYARALHIQPADLDITIGFLRECDVAYPFQIGRAHV